MHDSIHFENIRLLIKHAVRCLSRYVANQSCNAPCVALHSNQLHDGLLTICFDGLSMFLYLVDMSGHVTLMVM